MKVLIIGGVAGGATAAARLRRLDEKTEIVILERGGYVSFANCGMPYYVGGVITEKKRLTLQTPESFRARFRIDVRVGSEVTAIHPGKKSVTVRRLSDGSLYEESYDRLILSPGAKPVRPNLPGISDPRIFTLRSLEDSFALREFAETKSPRSAVVVGGGFIGLEMAENLSHLGISVTVAERLPQVMAPLDYDMACIVHRYLRSKGVGLRLNTSVVSFEDQGRLLVRFDRGEPLETDMVLLAMGVTPDTALARDAGLQLGVRGAIVTDDRMRTSDPSIYAVGDAVEVSHLVTGQRTLVPLAGPANKQGRIAADNICGIESYFRGSQGSSVLKLFDLTVAATGANETALKAAGISFDRVVTVSSSHATYYPGASNMTVKTIFQPQDGTLLGAQIVGFEGTDKRIDVLATAIRAGFSGEDLEELELAYAPPYSSAKDPVNMAGFLMGNLKNGLVKQFHWNDALPEGAFRLDVRAPLEFSRGHIAGAVNIPLDELRDRLSELPRAVPIYVNCQSGLRSYLACRILLQNGFDCYNLSGGYYFFELVTSEKEFDATPVHPCGIPVN